MTARPVSEWIASSPNASIPPRVRLRILLAYGGRCQCGCNRKIGACEDWQCDDRVALINGGERRESNLWPLLTEHHKNKTKNDVAIKSVTARKRMKHYGIKRAKRTIAGRHFNGDPIPSKWRA
jgi:5-methylcytosine-specific restriction enzyme A